MKYSSDIKKHTSEYLININNCGEDAAGTDAHICRSTGRSDYQLIYVVGGSCAVRIDGTIHIVHPGDCILYRPEEVQDYILSSKAGSHTYWIHFNGNMCAHLMEKLKLQKVYIIKTEQNREIEYLIVQILRHYNLKTSNNELICSGLMEALLALLGNAVYNTVPLAKNKRPNAISELISNITKMPNLKFSVEDGAQFCHMSKSHFSRVFKQTTGVPPAQFILAMRMERAKELLTFTDCSIEEIAENSGFQDQNYFARIFKKMVGVSPTKYRSSKR